MGLRLFSGSSSEPPRAPEPSPDHYEILRTDEMGGWTVALVRYVGCTTYEGCKLMVFDVPASVVYEQKRLDPHFLQQDNLLSPVARFEPTERGMELAELICRKH